MITVEPSKIKFPDEMPKMDKEKFFFCRWVNKISTKRKKNRRLFVITDWEFFVLKKKTFSKKLILSYSFRWYDINRIENDEENPLEYTIRFKNNKKKKNQTIQTIQNKYSKHRDYFTFKCKEKESNLLEEILKMLFLYLNSFHMPDDLPIFSYPQDFPFPIAKGSIPDHMRMKLRLNNHRISSSTLDILKNFVSSEPTEFCFTEIRGIVNSLPIFLECIYLAPTITTLIIPFNVNFNCIRILNDFLPENSTITSLIFKDKLPSDFSDFKDVFLSSSSTRMINSFKFINSNFSDQNVIDISKIIRNRTIRTLHLINSLNALTLKPFIQKIYDNPGFQSITTLTLDHTQSIDIRTLMPYLKNVVSLTLIHCEFEIADLFDVLTVDYQIASLNISQNNNDKQIFNEITFPRYLSNIVLRDIKWELLSLNNFLQFFMRHSPQPIDDDSGTTDKVNLDGENKLRLDLSQLEMSNDYWASFFEELAEKPRGSVVSLKWDDNPIDKRFVSYINSFLNLTTLSLNGSHIIDGEEGLRELLQFIVKSESLQTLSIAGTELKTLGLTTLDIIDTLYVNRSIKRIDISNHKCGNNLLIKLMDVLIENRVVEEIKFGKNDLNDTKLFEQFFIEIGSNRGKPLFTEFPEKFMKSALQFGSISNEDYNRIKKEFLFMQKGNSKKSIPEATVKKTVKKQFNMINYSRNPAVIDYDKNARKRRIERNDRFKNMKTKKVPLPQSTSLSDKESDNKDDLVDDIEDEADVDDEKVTTKDTNKKRKRKTKAKSSKKQEENADLDEKQTSPPLDEEINDIHVEEEETKSKKSKKSKKSNSKNKKKVADEEKLDDLSYDDKEDNKDGTDAAFDEDEPIENSKLKDDDDFAYDDDDEEAKPKKDKEDINEIENDDYDDVDDADFEAKPKKDDEEFNDDVDEADFEAKPKKEDEEFNEVHDDVDEADFEAKPKKDDEEFNQVDDEVDEEAKPKKDDEEFNDDVDEADIEEKTKKDDEEFNQVDDEVDEEAKPKKDDEELNEVHDEVDEEAKPKKDDEELNEIGFDDVDEGTKPKKDDEDLNEFGDDFDF